MTLNDGFDRTVSDWLDEQAGHGSPAYLDETLARTTRTRQRPWWASLERWLPVETTFSTRLQPIHRSVWAFVVLALVILAAAVLLLTGVGQSRVPHFGAVANGAIAFVDGADLKVTTVDGATIQSGTALPNGGESMRFSPDGRHLAYRTTTTPASLIVANADGSRPVVVSGIANATEGAQIAYWGPFAWSPDSRRLAFTETAASGARVIDVVNADGSRLAPLISESGLPALDRFDPAWSPDGQWISFFSMGTGTDSIAINVIRPDGTDARLLPTSPVNPDFLEMSWAPDPAQARLAFVSGGDVKIFDLVSSKESDVGTGFFASWSPDARRIAWWDAPVGAVAAPGSGGTQVAVVEQILAGAHGQVRLFPLVNNLACYSQTAVTGICGPVEWSPDSKWVFGPDPSGASIVFSTVDGSPIVRTIKLDHPFTESNGSIVPRGSLAWQPIAP